MGFGDYPIEYKPEVHGPYDPARFYGKGKFNEISIDHKLYIRFSVCLV